MEELMKKYLLIVFILTPFIVFPGEKEVSSFIGLSFGYVQNNLSYYYSIVDNSL